MFFLSISSFLLCAVKTIDQGIAYVLMIDHSPSCHIPLLLSQMQAARATLDIKNKLC